MWPIDSSKPGVVEPLQYLDRKEKMVIDRAPLRMVEVMRGL